MKEGNQSEKPVSKFAFSNSQLAPLQSGAPTLDDLRRLGAELASRAEAKAREHVAAAAASPAAHLPADAVGFVKNLLSKTPLDVQGRVAYSFE
jgi:hypothetical protein